MQLHGERAFGERENARCARKPGRQAGRHRMLASVRSREQRGGETLSKLELRI